MFANIISSPRRAGDSKNSKLKKVHGIATKICSSYLQPLGQEPGVDGVRVQRPPDGVLLPQGALRHEVGRRRLLTAPRQIDAVDAVGRRTGHPLVLLLLLDL